MGIEIIGDLFDECPDLTTGELAARIQADVTDVQNDGEIDPRARITVTSPGPGLLNAHITMPGAEEAATSAVARAVTELATHYQRVDLDHPEHARFRLAIEIADPHCGCVKSAAVTYGSLYPTDPASDHAPAGPLSLVAAQ
ncbi:hypothetical protein CLV63_11225 [Murinocardiopsis flavida]|uniref:Uncharacterized protein n=1 Tax=Murinocardiopsis flavida TaxID=645275 RepID=A0A2P8DG08_9ACTN|nr:hypothetical protein [Murinocardiopsis flavida]PSK96143.1 hypothetical protein CLV63_11225 [Murinocardiopsis flavida]